MRQDVNRPSLEEALRDRILILDGAMGTLIQAQGLEEASYRGEVLRNHPQPLLGNFDVLPWTCPEVVEEVHRAYLDAGADLIETCSFCANSLGQVDYGLEGSIVEMNRAAAVVARRAADAATRQDPSRPRYVMGSMGPTNRMASMSADVEDPGARAVDFDRLQDGYAQQVEGLLEGGVDGLLVETVFDTLNCKAALAAISELFEQRGESVPVMVSVTISDASGRTLSGQTMEAFWISVRHFPLTAIGLNCALGPAEMRPHLQELSRLADCAVLAYPNAGLPDELGQYRLGAEEMASMLQDFAAQGMVNLVGGCCGTSPEHIAAARKAVAGMPPRSIPSRTRAMSFAGLDPLVVRPDSNLLNIGERTNVAGSRRFARLIREGDYAQALAIARQQVVQGAQMVDVNMDDGLLDAKECMREFLRLLASEPDIARVPIMLDSSDWSVLEAGLRECQGRPVVNSLSLKDGEDAFRRRARTCRRFGAAVVVMAFDEQGQAVDVERRVAIGRRAVRVLREEGFSDSDILLDLNVLAIGTGIEEHDRYAVDFLTALRRLKAEFPDCGFSGGISNLSFSFRGADALREALHAVFLYHAVESGLTAAIVHAGRLPLLDELDPELRGLCEDLILARRPGVAEELLPWADRLRGSEREEPDRESWRDADPIQRLQHALVHGIADHLGQDLGEALPLSDSALALLEGPLMDGMAEVGERFGSGRMFLPQVVKSARVMKQAVAKLEPQLQDQEAKELATRSRPSVVLATVKGDVHDIGKNIVAVILACNGFEVIDLGVMVPEEQILQAASREGVVAVGLSGLITPSLHEMSRVASAMERTGLRLPLLIGGATTSRLHTALHIAPLYSGPTVHLRDASQAAQSLSALADERRRDEYLEQVARSLEAARQRHEDRLPRNLLRLEEARARAVRVSRPSPSPRRPGIHRIGAQPLASLIEEIDWTPFFRAWDLPGRFPDLLEDKDHGVAAAKLLQDAKEMLQAWAVEGGPEARAHFGLFAAGSEGDDIVVRDAKGEIQRLPMLRQQRDGRQQSCLSDLLMPWDPQAPDTLGAFVVSAGLGLEPILASHRERGDDYAALLAQGLADRLAEAFAEHLHHRVRVEHWGYAADEGGDAESRRAERFRGIRPAPGYPACPDHGLKQDLFRLLQVDPQEGIALTERGAMQPAASVCGLYFAAEDAAYFGVGPIGDDQLEDYAARCGRSVEEIKSRIPPAVR